MIGISGIDHICIAVKNLEEAKKVWGPFLGKKEPDLAYEDDFEAIRVARYYVGDVGYELMESTRQGSEIDKFIEGKGEGVMIVSFKVADVKTALNTLKDAGFRLIDEEPRSLRGLHYGFIHPKNMSGVLTELASGELNDVPDEDN